MAPMHPDARRKVMNAAVRGDALVFPTTYFLALHTTALTTLAGPSTATEVSTVGTGYARMPVTTAMLTTATTALSTCWLTTAVQFPDPVANWTTIFAVSMHDSSVRSSGGAGSTCWFFANVNTTINVVAGNPVRISSGNSSAGLTIGLS